MELGLDIGSRRCWMCMWIGCDCVVCLFSVGGYWWLRYCNRLYCDVCFVLLCYVCCVCVV